VIASGKQYAGQNDRHKPMPGHDMKGSPDNTVILHWDECQTSWMELPWRDWVRFRGLGEGGLSLLAGAEAGEHYFLVCVLGDRGELDNVIPHRYVLSTDAACSRLRWARRGRARGILPHSSAPSAHGRGLGALPRARRARIHGQSAPPAHGAAALERDAGPRGGAADRRLLGFRLGDRNLRLEHAAQLVAREAHRNPRLPSSPIMLLEPPRRGLEGSFLKGLI